MTKLHEIIIKVFETLRLEDEDTISEDVIQFIINNFVIDENELVNRSKLWKVHQSDNPKGFTDKKDADYAKLMFLLRGDPCMMDEPPWETLPDQPYYDGYNIIELMFKYKLPNDKDIDTLNRALDNISNEMITKSSISLIQKLTQEASISELIPSTSTSQYESPINSSPEKNDSFNHNTCCKNPSDKKPFELETLNKGTKPGLFSNYLRPEIINGIINSECHRSEIESISNRPTIEAWDYIDKNYVVPWAREKLANYPHTELKVTEQRVFNVLIPLLEGRAKIEGIVDVRDQLTSIKQSIDILTIRMEEMYEQGISRQEFILPEIDRPTFEPPAPQLLHPPLEKKKLYKPPFPKD